MRGSTDALAEAHRNDFVGHLDLTITVYSQMVILWVVDQGFDVRSEGVFKALGKGVLYMLGDTVSI